MVLEQHEFGVPPRNDKAHDGFYADGLLKGFQSRLTRRYGFGIGGQGPGRVDMTVHVVHPDQRDVERGGEAFCKIQADDQRARQTRAVGGRDYADIAPLDTGVDDCALTDRAYIEDVLSGRYFGDDAAVPSVDIDLRRDYVGEDLPIVVHYTHRRFVAAGFDSEKFHCYMSNVTTRPVIFPMRPVYFNA